MHALSAREVQSIFAEQEGICRSQPAPMNVCGISRWIANERYFLSPRMKRLKSLLAKLDPASAERTVAAHPAPKPPGEPSLLYRKLRGGGRPR